MTAGRWVLLLAHLPHALLGWTAGGFLLLFRRAHTPRWEEGVLTMTRRKGKERSLTFPRCIAYTEMARKSLRLKRHEQRVHVPQGEDLACSGWIFGAFYGGLTAGGLALLALITPIAWWVPVVVGLALWAVVWVVTPAQLAVEYLTAPLRHGVVGGTGSWLARFYRTGTEWSQHERSASSQADNAEWWDLKERQHKGKR